MWNSHLSLCCEQRLICGIFAFIVHSQKCFYSETFSEDEIVSPPEQELFNVYYKGENKVSSRKMAHSPSQNVKFSLKLGDSSVGRWLALCAQDINFIPEPT